MIYLDVLYGCNVLCLFCAIFFEGAVIIQLFFKTIMTISLMMKNLINLMNQKDIMLFTIN